ncbi:putative bifunctional diguanylate cyclase/phosphodiesterase [Sedimentitalea arenosa]|uniref:Bifunctional diguanylate cyclase/phosphodiesterase n=1 Tax=Sedimentitalea arenosa TaxID=2798803 RepID=A0A8J7IJW8_9RHOB|nr:bifunctional diguanylate cyclase/phosphodiesterase [Arenibacterium arenosum]MBJ6372947.1 bifunctional diguanylate cyclase/phosphodiesterase [Arenibacterium arenosum]
MNTPSSGSLTRLQQRIVPVLTGPPILAFLPAVTLGAFWLGGEQALFFVSLGLPLLFAFAGAYGGWPARPGLSRDSVTGLMLRDGFDVTIQQVFEDTEASGLKSACFVLEIDDYAEAVDRHGQSAADTVATRCGERILSVLRDGDTVARIGDSRFAVCLMAVRQLDLELCIQLSGRMQAAVEEPVSLGGLTVYSSCSIGFCLRTRAPGDNGQDWLEAANTALADARNSGPSAIRAFSAEMQRKTKARSDLRDDAATALENGQIQPWYQPQISTDTGKVTGFEALARWSHPVHGMIPPDVFLPVMEDAGLMERLGQVMLYHALTALKAWDSAGVNVPRVGVNFAGDELRNPGLVDKIRWELDRFELAPERLSVEILETVVTDTPDDAVTRNIAGLADLGCRIDLDDFGTGHASIASIRRFKVSRIKIDRSFVMKADRDPEQQRLIGAILTMAERLELETLAEGVETVGEHALLAQLGCDHVQGFGIARPMPFDQTLTWITGHAAKLTEAPRIGRDAG